MKETIERLQKLADRAKKYYWKDESEVVVKLSDVRAVLDFYEKTANTSEYTDSELNCKSGCMGPCGQCKDEPPNAPDITPEWDKIDEKYKWIAIDEGGDEFAFVRRPTKLYNHINRFNEWTARDAVFTGRYFDMSVIDWTKTLSKRPAK